MGRELKRVPLDFNWPKGFVWKGYMCPYTSQKCPKCGGTGHGPEYRALSDAWYGHGQSGDDHTPESERIYKENLHWMSKLEQDEVNNLCNGSRLGTYCEEFRRATDEEWEQHLNEVREKYAEGDEEIPSWQLNRERDLRFRRKNEDGTPFYPLAYLVNVNAVQFIGGHDSINHWLATDYRAKKLGIIEERWGCTFCTDGDIYFSEEIAGKINKEIWYTEERYHPPKGEGFQLWETVSEGSPVSKVFATGEEMIEWLVSDQGYSREASERFVKETGWVPSASVTVTKDGAKLARNIDTLEDL